MKLLFLQEHLYPIVGGAERSSHSLIKELRRRGHEVEWFCRWNIDRFQESSTAGFDVVVTQLNWMPRAVNLAKAHCIPSVVFVPSYENLCRVALSDPKYLADCGQACSTCPNRTRPHETVGRALRDANLIISNSNFMKALLADEHGVPSEVVYPHIDFEEFRTERRTKLYIATNQLSYAKGSDVFCQIAAQLPAYRFKIVGYEAWHEGHFLPENVTFVGNQQTKDVYSDVWLWLNPARWKEPFGRTNIEAQLNGIPVIATNSGAVRVDRLVIDGESGYLIDELTDVAAWLEAIKRAETNYQQLTGNIARRDFSAYSVTSLTDRFLELLDQLLDFAGTRC